jgi:hypothetical protein
MSMEAMENCAPAGRDRPGERLLPRRGPPLGLPDAHHQDLEDDLGASEGPPRGRRERILRSRSSLAVRGNGRARADEAGPTLRAAGMTPPISASRSDRGRSDSASPRRNTIHRRSSARRGSTSAHGVTENLMLAVDYYGRVLSSDPSQEKRAHRSSQSRGISAWPRPASPETGSAAMKWASPEARDVGVVRGQDDLPAQLSSRIRESSRSAMHPESLLIDFRGCCCE